MHTGWIVVLGDDQRASKGHVERDMCAGKAMTQMGKGRASLLHSGSLLFYPTCDQTQLAVELGGMCL
jgi:hypothetical protein